MLMNHVVVVTFCADLYKILSGPSPVEPLCFTVMATTTERGPRWDYVGSNIVFSTKEKVVQGCHERFPETALVELPRISQIGVRI